MHPCRKEGQRETKSSSTLPSSSPPRSLSASRLAMILPPTSSSRTLRDVVKSLDGRLPPLMLVRRSDVDSILGEIGRLGRGKEMIDDDDVRRREGVELDVVQVWRKRMSW